MGRKQRDLGYYYFLPQAFACREIHRRRGRGYAVLHPRPARPGSSRPEGVQRFRFHPFFFSEAAVSGPAKSGPRRPPLFSRRARP